MDSAKRACLAFIIGRAVNQDYQSVYDFGAGRLYYPYSNGIAEFAISLSENSRYIKQI